MMVKIVNQNIVNGNGLENASGRERSDDFLHVIAMSATPGLAKYFCVEKREP